MTTKEKVLDILAGAGESSVSGERIARLVGVTRAAVWKAVKSLREEGWQIEGTPNGGYALADKDIFTTALLKSAIAKAFPEFADCHAETFKVIDSTNTYAKRVLAECGPLRSADGSLTSAGKKYHRAVIVAESQTAGRGRLGRTFASPPKSGIYISVIYAPPGGITNPAMLTACTAVAICRAVRKLFGAETQIKWINDVFYHQKKICGILAEGVTNFESGLIESAVVGMGLNIKDNPDVFSGNLAQVAGSILGADAEKSLTRCQIAAQIAGEVLRIFGEDIENHKKIIEEYRGLSFLVGRTITVHPLIGDDKTAYEAKVTGIDDDARLIVERPDGEVRALNSGEVTLHSDN